MPTLTERKLERVRGELRKARAALGHYAKSTSWQEGRFLTMIPWGIAANVLGLAKSERPATDLEVAFAIQQLEEEDERA